MRVTSHTTLIVTKGNKPQEIPPGTPVDIDDDEAADLIKRGIAMKVAKAEAPAPENPAKNNGGGNPGAGTGQGGKQP